MFYKVQSGAVMGVNGYMVDVEVDITNGLPAFDIVGLPDSAVKESRERVKAAIRNTGFTFPVKRVTINLAPTAVRKSGPAFDLPIAVGILICSGMLKNLPPLFTNAFFAGELSLDGALRPVAGILPMAMEAKAQGIRAFFVPKQNAEEAALVGDVDVYPVENLEALTRHLSGSSHLQMITINQEEFFLSGKNTYDVDFADIAGQTLLKRAMEVAAAGYHNTLMIGPPGAGKTMIARRMPTILPSLSTDESMEITKIYSIAGLLNSDTFLVKQRPFRVPHHTASFISLAGGGKNPMPGEISLAHNGILFLDELPEFQKKALETLRQPMEDGNITITRAGGVCTYPSVFLLLAAMNPCPCGYMGTERCTCTTNETAKYLSKISGPLLDRIDIQIEAIPVAYKDLSANSRTTNAENSATIKTRVENARAIQQKRFKNELIYFNAKMTTPLIEKHCKLSSAADDLVRQVFDTMSLSPRAYHKILKIARTIADLADQENITENHIAEAISYRGQDRKYW